MDHSIVIVGGGPRGTYAMRRLALHQQRQPLSGRVDIHHFEKSGRFGGGGVHDPEQPSYLLLNTVASQITAFGDDDDEARRIPGHKTLYDYLSLLGLGFGPNDYPPRNLHGQYLAAMYEWTKTTLPATCRLHCHKQAVIDIEPREECCIVHAEDGQAIEADVVLLVVGHGKNEISPGSREDQWSRFARSQQERGKNRSYIHFAYPFEKTAGHIQPPETVYIIGMGLAAIDAMKAFTIGRGGKFAAGGYSASGQEPHLILGSRLGVPYAARGRNQREGQYRGKILTLRTVQELRGRKKKLDFQEDLMPLILHEMEYVYYSTLKGEAFGEEILKRTDPAERRTFIQANIPGDDIFSWQQLENPLAARFTGTGGAPAFSSPEDHRRELLRIIRADVAEARRGNLTSPLKTTVDSVLRDLRDTLRAAVNFGGLTPRALRQFYTQFQRVNNRVAVGPPVESIEELICLIEAGIVELAGPSPKVGMDEEEGMFFVESEHVAHSRREVHHILNGRIHTVDIRKNSSLLFQNLLARGIVRPYVNTYGEDEYEPGGLDINEQFEVIGADGSANPRLSCIGIPAEGTVWFNAVDARPDVNSTAITQVDLWARNAVRMLHEKE